MADTLVFGWRTAVLLVAFVQLVIIAAALLSPWRNRVANRTLSALLIILAGMITPWMIGFAGFYDTWHWLSFAPFAIPLAIAPLTYLYLHALIHQRWPVHGWRHLVPALLQFAYLTGAFVILRQPFKDAWLGRSALAYGVIVGLGVIVSLIGYGLRSRTMIAQYRTALAQQRSDDDRFALAWLGRTVAALFVLLAVWSGYTVWDLVQPLGYRGLMGLYLAIAAFALFLAIEGWRHAALAFPSLTEAAAPVPPVQDWMDKADLWLARVRDERLYADPELSVARLARLLGTNTAYVSRAFNQGQGVSFSTFINRLRCDDIAARLRAGDRADLIEMALDCGFSSKASFNRAFRAAYGCTPSAYRQAQASNPENAPNFSK
jgi:AraC-like DNA-binding protein